MPKQKVTLEMIAKQANLSIASVSRVLKKPQLTSWETQRRVRDAIKCLKIDLPYLFKSYQDIKSQKPPETKRKILIIDNQLQPYSLLNHTLESELRMHDYQIFYLRFANIDEVDIELIIHYTMHHIFDGILVINDAPYLNKLMTYHKSLPPIVLVNHFSMNFSCVYFDHLMLAYYITQHFINHGHKRIALLLGDKNKVSSRYLMQGYQLALQRASQAFEPNYIVNNCYSYEQGKLAIKCLMENSRPPSAVIFADHLCLSACDNLDRQAKQASLPYHSVRGALAQCEQMKIAIPDQLALIYFSHGTHKQYNELDTLSSVHKPLQLMAKKATHLLLKLVAQEMPIMTITEAIETNFIFRSST